MNFRKNLLLGMLCFLAACQTPQQKKGTSQESLVVNPVRDEFFAKAPSEEEAFQVFVNSDEYDFRQVGFEKSMTLANENTSKKAMSEEVGSYDLVDLFTEAIYRVELFKDSGLISHIRPIRPSKISEINKIIVDDITRLKFKFSDDKNIDPLEFKIRYGVQLRKKKSREEIKKILQENLN